MYVYILLVCVSSAMAMVSNSWTASRDIEHYGNWVCWPTTSLREHFKPERIHVCLF